MPVRILKYEILIIESAIDKRRFGQKEYKLPIVYPIVLYTGNKKWNVNNYISNIQESLEEIEKMEFSKYNVIDVNTYNEEELLKLESFYTKAMLIEKAKTIEEMVDYIEKITDIMNNDKNTYTIETREMFEMILDKIIRTKIGEKNTDKILEKFNGKGGDCNMMAVFEMIQKENAKIFSEGKIQGKIEGIKEIAKRLLKKNVSEMEISEITGLKKEEIRKLK